MNEAKPKPGPDPDRLQIEGDWRRAVKKSLEAEKPAEGWPKPAKKGKKASEKLAEDDGE